jgi:hypothetical protein
VVWELYGQARVAVVRKMNKAGTFSPKEDMVWPASSRKLDGNGREVVIMGGQDLGRSPLSSTYSRLSARTIVD